MKIPAKRVNRYFHVWCRSCDAGVATSSNEGLPPFVIRSFERQHSRKKCQIERKGGDDDGQE